MKRWIAAVLVVVLLCGLFTVSASAKELQVEVNGRDCARGAGKLVVYTSAYGESTGTNRWGAEAVVDGNNRVIEITNGNADIPADGFVVSGHDDEETPGGKRMKTWIQQNIAMGDYVYYNRRTSMLTVSDQPIAVQSPFFSFDNPADAVDVSRGENQMIVYTPKFGLTTGTNEYGYEVVVEDGVVTKLGGNNSVIPRNGYVVSLHGSPAKWMRLKIVKGMTVEYDPETLNVVFTYSAEGLKKAVEYSFECVQNGVNTAKETFVYTDHQAVQTQLDAFRVTYQAALDAFQKNKDENAFADVCDQLVSDASVLCNALCDSYPVQYRGVWIRPSQKNPAEVERYVKTLHDAGINVVSVEGWFENGVIMKVPEDSLFGRHPSFQYDVLQAYIDACHKYGMECHLWMPIFNVGSLIDAGYEERTVPGKKEEWLSLNQKGLAYNENGFMMIDPANEEAKAYFLDFYRYLVTTYDIDCFEMDYIRYYATTGEADFGYTDAAFAGFEEAYGHGVTPQYDREASYWEDWCQYRRDCITQWVREIREMMDREAPDMLLAADVAFPFEHALNTVYQNFPAWLEEGLLDILHPMAYGDGYGEEIKEAVKLSGTRCMVVTGLGAHMDMLGAAELERQARENNSYGAYGECYFEAQAYLADQVITAAGQTVYRNEALPMFLDTKASVAAVLDYMNGRIEEIILPLEGMTQAEADAVKAAVALAKEACDGEALRAVQNAVEAVANAQAKQALLKDLERAQRIVGTVEREAYSQATTPYVSLPLGWMALGAVVIVAAVAVAALIVSRSKKRKEDE
ncbi:MAG: hypothetical protein E7553_05775 [Ruminococcaceae bacterium]|nr:hypothetical protein [Oscillospiraceae bacterium]